MKKLILTVLILFITTLASADKIQVPFSVYPRQLQEDFSDYGLKLDLDPNERTPVSWGFLKNEGTEYWLYTYHNVTTEELEMLKEIIWKNLGVN